MVSYLDLALLIPIGWALWKGWKNGFVLEVFSLLALFAGLYIAVRFSDLFGGWLKNKMDVKAEYLPVTSFITILILVGVGLFFLGKVITRSVNSAGGETLNHIGGAVFSLMKFTLIMSVMFILFNMVDIKYNILSDSQKEKSYFYRPIYNFSLLIIPAFEKSDFYEKLKEKQMAPVLTGDTLLPASSEPSARAKK
ncbi:MAG: CvpA family protein [Crocinitomicaceae bacterium]|nr:CvpA family protein [Crocinitomicaceae bacterium]